MNDSSAYTIVTESVRMLELTELMAFLAHELNQPLSALSAYTGALQHSFKAVSDPISAPNAQRLSNTLDRIASQSVRAAQVMQTHRAALEQVAPSHPAGGSVDIAIDRVVSAIYTQFPARFASAAIPVTRQSTGLLSNDQQQPLEGCLMHILRNATEATPVTANGEHGIEVKVECSNTDVMISVFNPATHFDSAAALHWFTTTKAGHLGIGLPVCAQYMERIGGALTTESTDAGQTCVALRLPRTA
ncbi:MAG: HAMP domain-containing histidine kinase [Gammaproteobacteria bacterium]|nr:HAMP domain-containing histidine kinase [Gammaproteobacteria bacterium]